MSCEIPIQNLQEEKAEQKLGATGGESPAERRPGEEEAPQTAGTAMSGESPGENCQVEEEEEEEVAAVLSNPAAMIWQQIEGAVEDPISSEAESGSEEHAERLPFKLQLGRGRGSARSSGSTRCRGRGSSGGSRPGASARSSGSYRSGPRDDDGSLSEASGCSSTNSFGAASSARFGGSQGSWAVEEQQSEAEEDYLGIRALHETEGEGYESTLGVRLEPPSSASLEEEPPAQPLQATPADVGFGMPPPAGLARATQERDSDGSPRVSSWDWHKAPKTTTQRRPGTPKQILSL